MGTFVLLLGRIIRRNKTTSFLVIAGIAFLGWWYFSGPRELPATLIPVNREVALDPNRIGDVIFIHGLEGDAYTTWEADGTEGTFWPKWLSEEFPRIGFWTMKYPSHASYWFGSGMALEDRGANMLQHLSVRKIGNKPIIFIGHSFGGLVAKQLLRDAFELHDSKWEHIGKQTKGVLFLSTPNTGASGADLIAFADRLAPLLVRGTVQAEQLKTNAPVLRGLNRWFTRNATRNGIEITAFFENESVAFHQVVGPSSADPGITDARIIGHDADHIEIAKPVDKDDLVYLTAVDFINECIIEQPTHDNISFRDFIDEFLTVYSDPAKFANFKEKYKGKRFTWQADIIYEHRTQETPNYSIAVLGEYSRSAPALAAGIPLPEGAAKLDMHERVKAKFDRDDFELYSPGESVVIEGTFDNETLPIGVMLRKCKIVGRANKENGDD